MSRLETKGETKKVSGAATAGLAGAVAGRAVQLKATGGMDAKSMEAKLGNLSSTLEKDRRAAKKASRNKDTISTLLGALTNSPKFTKMVEYSVTCIKGLSVDVVSALELVDSGVIEALKNVLNLNPYNERIQELVNGAISALCVTDEIAQLVGEKLGCKEMLRSMNKHTSPETLISTCKATTRLMRSNHNLESFNKEGVIPALSHVIKTAKGNVDVIAAAAGTLSRVADDSKAAQAIMDTGCVAEILACLKSNPDNKELITGSLGVLTKMARADPKLLAKLREMGAVDIIVGALDRFPDDKSILTLGTHALQALSNKSDVTASLSHISSGTAENSVETASALSKIASLMLVESNVDHMVKNEGIGWLVSALSGAVGDPSDVAAKILFSGCQAIMRVCTDENRIYNVMQKGGVKLLVSIINGHVKDERVACAAVNALTQMLTRKENVAFLIKSQAIPAVQALLKAHPDSVKAALTALEFFAKMALHEGALPKMIEAGVVENLIDLMKRFKDNPEIIQQCITTLGRMATSAENMAKIAAAGGLEALVAVLADHKDNADLCKAALLLLETSALLPANIEALRKIGAVASILNALALHPKNPELTLIGSRVLAKLNGQNELKDATDNVMSLAKMGVTGAASSNLAKLQQAVSVLGKLTLVEKDLKELIKMGADKALYAAFEAAVKLPAGEAKAKLLTETAAGLLRMAKNAEVGQSLVKSGGFNNMLKAALANKENEQLAEQIMALAAALLRDSANVARMIKDGAIEDICALAKAHALNEKILAQAAAALGCMATSEENIMKIIANGGAEILIEALFANMDNPDVVANVLETVATCAINEEAIQALLKAGALDAIIESIRTYPDNAAILTQCFNCLCRLLISEEVASQIGEKGAIPLLVKAMRQHYQVEPLCEIDMILMDSLASLPANGKRLLEKDLATVELVKWIASAFPSNTALVEAAAKLILTLTGPTEEEKAKTALALSKEEINFDNAKCDVLLQKMKSTKLKPDEQLNMLLNLAQSLQNPENAKMFLEKGGLKALAAVMKQSKDNEKLFYAAASGFLTLSENGGDNVINLLEEAQCIDALCDMMNAHELFETPMNLNDLTRAVGCVAKMKLSPATVNELLKNQPLSSLVKILMQSDDPLLLAQAARLLGKLSNNEAAAALLHKIVNIRELIGAMRRNMKNEEFLKYAVFLLGNLAQNEQLSGVIGIEGGIQLILQIMELYATNAPLIENCCFAMANLTFGNEVNCSFTIACKGVLVIIAALGRHTKAEELLESAVCVLNNLCRVSDSNKEAIIKANGAQAIVDTVLNNFNSLELLLTCFRTLGNLAYNTTTITMIIKAGGVQGIVAGMTVHAEEQEVIEIAIKVLTNLSAEEDTENMTILAQEGAVQAVTEVLNQYTDNPDLEQSTFGCLCNLARFKENAKIMILQGGVKSTIKCLTENKFSADLVEGAMRLLSLLASNKEEVERVIDAKTTSCILQAIKTNRSETRAIALGFNAIMLMSHSGDAATRVASEGPIDVIVSVINENPTDFELHVDAFGALSALARADKNSETMAEPAMKAVVACYKGLGTNSKWLSSVFTFLGNICVTPAAAEFVVSTQLIAPTLLVLKRLPEGSPLMRGLRALENMAYGSDKVKDYMKREGVEATCNQISELHNKDDIKRACKAVIDALTRSKLAFASTPMMEIKKKEVAKATVRDIFGDEKPDSAELKQEVKNFLTSGMLLQKHSNNAAPRSRHVYVTTDLKFLVWKDPKKHELDDKNKMKVFKIRSLERGRCTPQLQRKTLMGKFLAKEECSFAVMGRERTVDLETKTEAERDKWMTSLQALMDYRKAQKAINTKFDAR